MQKWQQNLTASELILFILLVNIDFFPVIIERKCCIINVTPLGAYFNISLDDTKYTILVLQTRIVLIKFKNVSHVDVCSATSIASFRKKTENLFVKTYPR